MAIGLQHGPISAAGRLAQMAGEGEEFRFRFGAERQLTQEVLGKRQMDESNRARDIQLAMAQQAQDAAISQRQQQIDLQRGKQPDTLPRERLEFEKEKFAKDQPRKEAQTRAATDREKRLAEQPQDPTEVPAFKAMQQILAPYERQAERLQKEAERAATGVSFADPRVIEAQQQQLMATPINMPDGSQATVGDLFGIRDSYLSQALPVFEAARMSQEAAHEKAQTEAQVDETIDELSADLPPSTPTPQILQKVIERLGKPALPEEAQIIADAVNAIEQKIRKRAGQPFPGSFD